MTIIFNVLSLLAGCYVLFYGDNFAVFILGQRIDIWFLMVPLLLSFGLIFVKDFIVKKLGLFGTVFIFSLNILISFFIGGLAFKVAASYMVFREKIINNSFFVLKRIKWTEEEYIERARFLLWNREGTEGLNLDHLYKELKPRTMAEWDLQLENILKKIQEDLLEKKLKFLEAKLHNVENQLFLLNNQSVMVKGWRETLLYDYLLEPKVWIAVGVIGLGVGLGYAAYSGMFTSKISLDPDIPTPPSESVNIPETVKVPDSVPTGLLTVDTRLEILESEYDKVSHSLEEMRQITAETLAMGSRTKIKLLEGRVGLLARQMVDLIIVGGLTEENKIERLNLFLEYFKDNKEMVNRLKHYMDKVSDVVKVEGKKK